MSIGLIAVTCLFLYNYGWNTLTDNLMQEYGARAFNPFIGGQYGWDRVCLDIFLAFASVLTWQTMITRVLAARDTKTGQGIYRGTSPFFLVRFALPALFGIVAFYYFTGRGALPSSDILAMPAMIAAVVPIGLLGILIAAMLAADMSTNSSYLLAWSSVIYNDILEPFHRNKWSEKRGLRVNRMLVGAIGIFLLLYGLWYPLKGDLWVYLQITGTIYLASMSVILIAGCYWKEANSWGAIGAIITGAFIPVTYLILQQITLTHDFATAIGPYKAGIATYVLTGSAMVVGSCLKNRIENRNISWFK
jgi:SSS family solute:Na+ symporter